MSEEFTSIPCEKCGAKLRVKTLMLKVMREAKCGKCGSKVLLQKKPAAETPAAVAPAPKSEAPVAASTPAPSPEPTPDAATPPPPTPSAPPAPVMDTAALEAAKARIVELEGRLQSVEAENLGLKGAHEQVATLQAETAQLRDTLRQRETELAVAKQPSDEVARLRKELSEQSARVTELQQLWIAEQKEARVAHDRADRSEQDRAAMAQKVEVMLRDWHSTEIMASQGRLRDLQDRIQALVRTKP